MQARKAPVAKRGAAKLVYFFGGGKADGNAGMKNLLGGKGANLAEMAGLGLPVPPGFTITTEVCTYYYENGRRYPAAIKEQVGAALAGVEKILGLEFGDPKNPLLLSVRSGARSSMPGMMETILNVGLTSATIPGMIAKTGNPRFVYDAYRRLIMMYADVVMEKAAGIEPADGQGVRAQLEHLLEELKLSRGYTSDTQITAAELEGLCARFKLQVREVIGKEFPGQRGRPALGRHRRRLPVLERQARDLLPPDRGHPGRLGDGGRPCSPWSSATWATTAPPAWRSPATRAPARTPSTASGS